MLSDALSDRGYEVATANTIRGGLQQAAQLEPEYAVIDLRIGHESGLAFAEQLHKLDENTRMDNLILLKVLPIRFVRSNLKSTALCMIGFSTRLLREPTGHARLSSHV